MEADKDEEATVVEEDVFLPRIKTCEAQ